MARTTPSTSIRASIDRLIINPSYEEPGRHWRYHRETRRFLFCQLVAVETLIWLTDSAVIDR